MRSAECPSAAPRPAVCSPTGRGTPRSAARPIVPREEECWPVAILVERYPQLRFERWLPSVLRSIEKSSGVVFDERLLRGPRGRPLCLWCGTEPAGGSSTALFCPPPPPPPRRAAPGLQFGEGCEHEHRLRRNNQYVRKQLLMRDGGVCAECGVDAHELFMRASRCATLAQRTAMFKRLARENPDWHKKVRRPLASMDCEFTAGMFWEAAHVVDVRHGGGLCGLGGFHTLCVPCHAGEFARNYIQDLSDLSPYLSSPRAEPGSATPAASTPAAPAPPVASRRHGGAAVSARKENATPAASRPRTANSDCSAFILLDSQSSASSSPSMPSPGRCLAARGPERAHETPTKRGPGSLRTRPCSLSRPPAPHLAAVIDLTAPPGDPPLCVYEDELDALAEKLITFNISSSDDLSDGEVVLVAAAPRTRQIAPVAGTPSPAPGDRGPGTGAARSAVPPV
ncbi:hypothetical protein LPJ61_000951 [Coemansia biformis]|uniref:HNH domain-containing protein n=1 Tax=Coemansia biformis TaxID=1286918 RepID=A0A9W8CYK7_9FUNG|nr:hypothetical protein LPJ61_000951 [Coemansia biformis]